MIDQYDAATPSAAEPAPERPPAIPPGVIVAGMHRSATSLTTSVLIGCGWHADGPMLPTRPDNPRGYFEDSLVHDLHVNLLRGHRASWDTAGRLRELRRAPISLGPRAADVDAMVEHLHADGPWIWKNPRATLFLEEWGRRLPEALVVICLRSPAAVADSLLRRGSKLRVTGKGPVDRLRRVVQAISLWHTYNLIAYRFAQAHPERVSVVRVPTDLPVLAAATQPSRFEPELMSAKPRLKFRLMAALALPSQLLYFRLWRLHDRAKLAAVLAGPPA